jgi:hypothetical protein
MRLSGCSSLALLVVGMALTGCGGSGGSSTVTTPPPVTQTPAVLGVQGDDGTAVLRWCGQPGQQWGSVRAVNEIDPPSFLVSR